MVRFNLKYNRMVELRQRMFLPSLVTLLLSNNRVQTLTNDIFVFLKFLKFLDFSANRLNKIENAAFSGLVNFQTLYLNNNNLDSPDSDSDYFFWTI
jgi:Leucine-rich repeat (LRR) protein